MTTVTESGCVLCVGVFFLLVCGVPTRRARRPAPPRNGELDVKLSRSHGPLDSPPDSKCPKRATRPAQAVANRGFRLIYSDVKKCPCSLDGRLGKGCRVARKRRGSKKPKKREERVCGCATPTLVVVGRIAHAAPSSSCFHLRSSLWLSAAPKRFR